MAIEFRCGIDTFHLRHKGTETRGNDRHLVRPPTNDKGRRRKIHIKLSRQLASEVKNVVGRLHVERVEGKYAVSLEIGHVNLRRPAVYKNSSLAGRLFAPGHPLQQTAERRKVMHFAQFLLNLGAISLLYAEKQHTI